MWCLISCLTSLSMITSRSIHATADGIISCFLVVYVSVQFSHSVVSNSLWPHGLQHIQPSLSITNSRSLLRLMSIESVMPSNHLILCHPLLLPPSIFPSIRVFSNESVLLIRWPKDWSFSFSIRPSNEHLGLISFRMDWLDLLAFQEILKSLLQHHSSKASILRCSAFFKVCHYQFRIIFSCVPTVSQSEGRNRQCRLRLESPSPSWAGLWTLSSMPCIYGNDIPTGKPDGRAPGRIPRLPVN